MSSFFDVFVQNVLPIFLVAAVGYVLRSNLGLDKRTLSKLVFYAFSPALVFTSLTDTRLGGEELVELVAFTFIMVLLMGLVGLVLARLFRLPRSDTIALMLILMFVNGGNYGLTVNELRHGSAGLSRAVVYYVTSTTLVYTIGIYIASMGRGEWSYSMKQLFRLPAFYAVVAALVVYGIDIAPPAPLMNGLKVAAAGAIPVMLVVLGMQIADLKSLDSLRLAIPASLLRLMLAPLLAVFVASTLNLRGLSHSVAVIEASMPTAVLMTILGTEYEVRPGMITSTVVISTLLSAVTLPAVIIILGL